MRIEEMLEFIRLADPLVDLFDVTVGSWPEDSGTSRYFPEGYQLSWTERVREATSTPIVGVGRYTNPDQMAALMFPLNVGAGGPDYEPLPFFSSDAGDDDVDIAAWLRDTSSGAGSDGGVDISWLQRISDEPDEPTQSAGN